MRQFGLDLENIISDAIARLDIYVSDYGTDSPVNGDKEVVLPDNLCYNIPDSSHYVMRVQNDKFISEDEQYYDFRTIEVGHLMEIADHFEELDEEFHKRLDKSN